MIEQLSKTVFTLLSTAVILGDDTTDAVRNWILQNIEIVILRFSGIKENC